MTYTPPPFPSGLKPGSDHPSAKSLQAALKTAPAHYLSGLVPADDMYGPQTVAAVKRFHAANPSYGTPTDGAIGPQGWAHLNTEAYGPHVTSAGEPPADYTRHTYSGVTVNERTRVLLGRAAASMGWASIPLVQGSYHKGVSASAGTHDGGGVVDVNVAGLSSSRLFTLVGALRRAGFAAWRRTPAEGFDSYHIHACAIGDAQMAPLAKQQVHAYFNGRNGLAGNGPDDYTGGRPFPSWAAKYK